MNITIVGTGLIGGSLAISLRKHPKVKKIIGVDQSEENLKTARELRLIDEALSLDNALAHTDLIILAIPINSLEELLPKLMDRVDKNQIVMDVGSTKSGVIKALKNHPKRGRFVATHPMAGTEYSGPKAAVDQLFDHKCAVICNAEDSDSDALEVVQGIYKFLNMKLVYLDAKAHDVHAAYVSHISHISSFALALTVLEKEKQEDRIFELASGGFRSTARLAKSSAAMWVPIFMENEKNILDVMEEMTQQLEKMKTYIKTHNNLAFYDLITKANEIKRILS